MKVQDILTDERHWTQGSFAKQLGSGNIHLDHYRADVEDSCFCLWGALERAYGSWSDEERKVRDKLETMNTGCGGSITSWNDAPERTFPEVRALIEELDI